MCNTFLTRGCILKSRVAFQSGNSCQVCIHNLMIKLFLTLVSSILMVPVVKHVETFFLCICTKLKKHDLIYLRLISFSPRVYSNMNMPFCFCLSPTLLEKYVYNISHFTLKRLRVHWALVKLFSLAELFLRPWIIPFLMFLCHLHPTRRLKCGDGLRTRKLLYVYNVCVE